MIGTQVESLGAPERDTRNTQFDTGHVPPVQYLMYLGPVEIKR